MLIHHIAAFLSVALASFTGQAHLYTLLLLSTELTTPFVNARWVFDHMVRQCTVTAGHTALVMLAVQPLSLSPHEACVF